jgi:N-acetylated-alpha-linked acidic dipeptidase
LYAAVATEPNSYTISVPFRPPANHELALDIAEVWKRQGLEEVRIHRYDVLTSMPRAVEVEMVAPVRYRAPLREDAYAADADTRNPAIRGGYLAMPASGEATAPVVYAHSGNPEDYEVLRRRHISVRGKIVLARYSNPYSYRGFKALTAQREGAAGMLIDSDPAEDGYRRGRVFPDGPWGPESHIQRGSITYDFLAPGDPLTPGWAWVDGARRIPIGEAVSVPKIMAAPSGGTLYEEWRQCAAAGGDSGGGARAERGAGAGDCRDAGRCRRAGGGRANRRLRRESVKNC